MNLSNPGRLKIVKTHKFPKIIKMAQESFAPEPVESDVTIGDSMSADEKEQLSYGLRDEPPSHF